MRDVSKTWILAVFFAICMSVVLAIEPTFDIQGRLRNTTNGADITGTFDFNVTYNTDTGTHIYSENSSISVSNGIWNYYVGYYTSITPLTWFEYWSQSRYITQTLKLDTESTAEMNVSSVPMCIVSVISNQSMYINNTPAYNVVDLDRLENGTIIRDSNTTWITTNQNTNNSGEIWANIIEANNSLLYRNDLDNSSLIRAGNTTWITENQNTNSSVDIKNIFGNSSNITFDSTNGVHILNITCEQITGSSGLCDGSDDGNNSQELWDNLIADNETIQFSINTNCSADNYVYGITRTGTLLCRADNAGSGSGTNFFLDDGNHISLNATYGTTLNASTLTSNWKTNITDGDIYAANYYDDGVLLQDTHNSSEEVFRAIDNGTFAYVGWDNNTFLGSTINDTELASEDFGDFTCTGSEDGCTFNTDSVGDNEIDYTEVTTGDFTINDANFVANGTDANHPLLNVTTNLTITSQNIWYNGSGICIGQC